MVVDGVSGGGIAKVNYTHDAMIDLLIANPEISQGAIAAHFGYTPPWVSRVIRSDAFRERLAARKGELVDPLILQAVEQRFEVLLEKSLAILERKLDTAPTFDMALKAAELGSRALGYGAKQGPGVQVQNNFVVAMPTKAASSEEWLANRRAIEPAA